MKRWWVLGLLAFSLGCDDGPRHLKTAKEKYQALVEARKPPTDVGFDDVLGELGKISKTSGAHDEAQKIAAAITAVRNIKIARPLARAPLAEDGVLRALELKCSQLAKQLGETSGPARDRVAVDLKKCEAARAARDDELAHADSEPAHEGGPEGHAPVGAADAGDAGAH